MVTYEQRLNQDRRWARLEGSMHFEKGGAVHQTLEKLSKRLEQMGIPYALAGAMALFEHGYRRFTEDVDVLVTKEGLRRIHDQLEGRGYVPPFEGSKNLRDSSTGVRIEFLVAGDYPGDGAPKPVAFPDPESSSLVLDGIRVLTLPKLIELKLASGMSAVHRRKDLVDVQELIAVLGLPREFGDQLDPFVRDKYHEFWQLVHDHPAPP
jgi:hypothetical protein